MSKVELEVIKIKLGEQVEEAQQEINGNNHIEEMLTRLNDEAEAKEVNET